VLTTVGITTEIAMFDNQNDATNGPVFSTFNGSWASLIGSTGFDPVLNQVLIAQITTNGVFSFELNIQIGTPTGGVEQYVALSPTGAEIQIPSLIYPDLTTSVNDLAQANAFVNIYPNPAKDLLWIDISNSKSTNNNYSIYDAKGSLLAQKKLEEISHKFNDSVDISSFPQGLYFVVVSLDGVVTSKKIVIN